MPDEKPHAESDQERQDRIARAARLILADLKN